jgi:hypothetical protein
MLKYLTLFGFLFLSHWLFSTLPFISSSYDCDSGSYNFSIRWSNHSESYKWDFGDGTTEVMVGPSPDGNYEVNHIFDNTGSYTVKFYQEDYLVTSIPQRIWVGLNENLSNPIVEQVEISNNKIAFYYKGKNFNSNENAHSFRIDYGDGTFLNLNPAALSYGDYISTHIYATTKPSGNYNVALSHCVTTSGELNCCVFYLNVSIEPCCTSFSLIEEKAYGISAWVSEGVTQPTKHFANSYIEVEFIGGANNDLGVKQFYASGEIIDGWQRIVGSFDFPGGCIKMKLNMVNQNPLVDAYFDDIRIHPFDASMKSYVYDPVTLQLVAELDDSNYATFYEYDKEGNLIRIKKETSRGIRTIQESRSSNPKKELFKP